MKTFVIKSDKDLEKDKFVDYSVKKYGKAYKLLEEYDKKSLQNPEDLADAGRLRTLFQKFKASLNK